jgi:hypothetical protein
LPKNAVEIMKKNSILEQLKAKEQQDLEEAEKFA